MYVDAESEVHFPPTSDGPRAMTKKDMYGNAVKTANEAPAVHLHIGRSLSGETMHG
jgi:hypothetical protein